MLLVLGACGRERPAGERGSATTVAQLVTTTTAAEAVTTSTMRATTTTGRASTTTTAIRVTTTTRVALSSTTVAVRPGRPGEVTMSLGTDPETHAAGIDIVFAWSPGLDSSGGALVQLYQNDRLVGQIPYTPGWEGEVPAFFRTSPAAASNAFHAVGRLFDRNHREVPGSRVQSSTVHWHLTVQPGQVVAV